MSNLMEHAARAERKRTGPTPALAAEAMRKVLAGDKRAEAVVKRWIAEGPEAMLEALETAVSEKLGYREEAIQ